MATQISTEETSAPPQGQSAVKLSDLAKSKKSYYELDPADLETSTHTGRSQPVSSESIEDLAESMVLNGQLHPAGIAKTATGYKLVWGHGRARAVKLINDAGLNGDTPFLLACVVAKASSEREHFLMTLAENNAATPPTPMDDAENIDALIADFGMTPEEVAGVYRKSAAWVSKRRALTKLGASLQKFIRSGSLSAGAAYNLTMADSATQKGFVKRLSAGEVITKEESSEAATKAAGSADSAAASDSATGTGTGDKTPAASKPPRKKGRPRAASKVLTIKQVRLFVEELKGYEGEDDPEGWIADLGRSLGKFLEGKLNEKGLLRALKVWGSLIEGKGK